MSTLTVHPRSEKQEQALKAFFEAFDIQYEREMDETEYLTSSPANSEALNRSIQQVEKGKTTKISIDDLWK